MLDGRGADRRENHEQLIALDRVIAFENALVVGIQPAASFERNVATTRSAVTVTVIFREDYSPTIWRFASIGFLCRGVSRRRQRNVDDYFLTRFNYDVLERVAARDREISVVLIFIK